IESRLFNTFKSRPRSYVVDRSQVNDSGIFAGIYVYGCKPSPMIYDVRAIFMVGRNKNGSTFPLPRLPTDALNFKSEIQLTLSFIKDSSEARHATEAEGKKPHC